MAHSQHKLPAVEALRSGQLSSLREALEAGVNPNLSDTDGLTLLVLAAALGRDDAVGLLLEHGADPNRQAEWGRISPLMAATNGGNDRIAKILLKAGADPNLRDQTGTTALMYAVDSGKTDVVQTLLSAGAEVGATDDAGRSASERRRRSTHGVTLGSMANGTLRSRHFSYPAASNDPILRLLSEALGTRK